MLAYQASAQYAQYWDDAGTGTATNGTWDTTSTFWASNTATASTVPFTNGNFACFAVGSAVISTLNINVPGQITVNGIGNGDIAYAGTSTAATGVAVDALTFSGAGSINLPSGIWQFCCGSSSAQNTYFDLPIVGTGGIEQRNTGQLYLYGNNTYSGGTLITGGQILFYNSSNSFGVGPITNTSASSIEISNGLSGIITITNPIVEASGSSTFNFASGNTISSGPWSLFSSTAAIKNNGSGSTPVTLSGPISGAFGIYLQAGNSSSATITLSGQNTYTGPTGIGYLITGATTVVSVTNINSVSSPPQQASSCLGKPSSVANGTISMGYGAYAGQLTYTGPGETSDRNINLSGQTGGAIIEMDGAGPLIINGFFSATTNGAKTVTLQGTSTAANAINGCISNSTSATALTKAQAGNWTLGGTNTFTGNLTVSGGTLTIGGSGDLDKGSYGGAISIATSTAFVYDSSVGSTLSGVISGAGSFTLASPVGTSVTLSGSSSTFTGLWTDNSGTLSIDSDAALGTDPGSVVANDITLNGGPGASLRANANGISLNANRGIFLGPNGGSIQVAGNDTFTYNGVITGSGPFQNGQNSSTGLGVLVLSGAQAYTNWTVLAAGTLRLTLGASLGNSAGILMSNTPILDVSTQAPFALSTTNNLTVIGTSNTPTAPATILGPSGSTVNFGSQTVNLSYNPAGINGDASHQVLTVLQSSLTLNGNTINVTNATGSTLDVGNYALIQCANGFTISTLPTLNYVGSQAANTTANLAVVGDMLVLQILPTSSYSGSTFTNVAPYPGQSAIYGTPTATFSGTVINGASYGAMGETVNVAIPNVETNSTTISDNTGDFSLTMDISTVPVGTYAVNYSYSGPSLASALDTSTALTITKATLAVGATNQTKVYGTTLVTTGSTEFTNSATQNGETIGSVTLSVNGSPAGSVSNAPIGNYIITPSAATGGTFSPGNYTITYITNSLVIVPLPVGETGTRLYDGTATATNKILSITNVVGTDNVTNINGGNVTLATSAAGAETIVSPGTLTIGGLRATNYTTIGMIGAVTVNPLPVGLTGTRYFDGTSNALYSILTITNVIGTDDVSPASGSVMLKSAAVGTDPIISGGTLALGGAQAADYTSIGATGAVVVAINTSPTNIVFSTANNAMTLQWPVDHTGWTLEAQTNSVSTGIGSNWVPVTGSTATNQVTVTVDPGNGCVFYELLYNP